MGDLPKQETLMSLPDGPKSPKIWQMLRWITMPFSFMRGCNDRYGDCFTATIGQKIPSVVFFSNPQALQVILTSDNSELFDSPGELNALLEPLLGAQSVMGLSGDRHRRMRQLLMPSFHGERMRSYGQLIRDITEEVIALFDQALCICFAAGEALDIAHPGGDAVERRLRGGYFNFVNVRLLFHHANGWLCRHAASIDAATKRANERDRNRRAEYI
jgi:hypothetical protein